MDWDLENKTVIVTGGAKGIGRVYVQAFADAGARVAIADIDLREGENLASELTNRGKIALAKKVDICDFPQCQSLAKEVWNKWGSLDILVNNAAIYSTLRRKSFTDISGEEWDQVMGVNLKGMLFCCQAVYPYMKQNKHGKIINISSAVIFKGSPFFLHYVTSKGGVMGFTRALAREIGSDGICVNTVSPGLIETGVNEDVTPQERFKTAISERSLKRPEVPKDLVGTVLFLASGHSDFITGQLINVDGGTIMY